jgi:hypothetical protein
MSLDITVLSVGKGVAIVEDLKGRENFRDSEGQMWETRSTTS